MDRAGRATVVADVPRDEPSLGCERERAGAGVARTSVRAAP